MGKRFAHIQQMCKAKQKKYHKGTQGNFRLLTVKREIAATNTLKPQQCLSPPHAIGFGNYNQLSLNYCTAVLYNVLVRSVGVSTVYFQSGLQTQADVSELFSMIGRFTMVL